MPEMSGTTNMDLQTAFNLLVMICGAMGGWILGRISKSLDRLDEDMRQLPEKYVSKVDYHNDMQDIKGALLRIETKLDGKVDK